MEFLEIILSFKEKWRLIFILTFINAILFAAFAYFWPTSYKASVTMYVQRIPEKTSNVYTYDGYYAGQAAENYTDTVKGLVGTLDIIQRAAEISSLSTAADNLKVLAKHISVLKSAPQLVEVIVTLNNKEQARSFSLSLAQAASERAGLLNQDGDKYLNINIVNPNPIVEAVRFDPVIFALAGLLFGFIFSLTVVSFRNYLKITA